MKEITYKDALNEALREEMTRDPYVILMGEDIAQYGGIRRVTAGLMDKFGEDRVRDTPISESAIVGTAIGMAITGMRPVVEISYIDFSLLAFDQIVNQAAKIPYMTGGQIKLPLVIRTQGGAGAGSAAQHSQSLEALFAHIPGLKIAMPSTPYDAKGLLKTAIRDNTPVIFIEHKMLYLTKGLIPEEEYLLSFGVADIKKRGNDVTIVATSAMVAKALRASIELERNGINSEVIDLRTIVPLDKKTVINSVKKTGHLVIVHEACKFCGIGGEIAATVGEEAFDYIDAPIKRVGARSVPIPYADSLEKFVIPDERDIINAVQEII